MISRKVNYLTITALGIIFFLTASLNQVQGQDFVSERRGKSLRPSWAWVGLGAGPVWEGTVLGTQAGARSEYGWGATIRYNHSEVAARYLPADYHPGLCVFGSCRPKDYINSVGISVSRDFDIRSAWFRFGLEAGPTVTQLRRAWFLRNTSGGWFSSNYEIIRGNQWGLGGIFRAKTLFLPSRIVGLEASLFLHLNQFQHVWGIEFHLLTGKLRARRDRL